MTREQAINYLIGRGITEYRVSEIVRALTYEPATKNNLGVDCISRADAIKAMQDKAKKLKNEDTINGLCGAVAILFDLPSVTPQEPRCKDCKWWKDSDGEYRRGCGAESICRINTDKVYQGEGYCYLYEPNILER